MDFTINAKSLHRVFNNIRFDNGGRFYGGFHESMPEKLRNCIRIDGQEIVELDYAAHHLRMPYHLLEIDYQNDPYLVLSDDKKERKIYKKLCLIAINATSETKAIKAFRELARIKKAADDINSEKNKIWKELKLTNESLKLGCPKSQHPEISSFLSIFLSDNHQKNHLSTVKIR